MIKVMKIHGGKSLPPVVVEVVSPELETIRTVMIADGEVAEVNVPSAESFLRVRTPTGGSVSLAKQRGSLDRVIERGDVGYGTADTAPAAVASLKSAEPAGEIQFFGGKMMAEAKSSPQALIRALRMLKEREGDKSVSSPEIRKLQKHMKSMMRGEFIDLEEFLHRDAVRIHWSEEKPRKPEVASGEALTLTPGVSATLGRPGKRLSGTMYRSSRLVEWELVNICEESAPLRLEVAWGKQLFFAIVPANTAKVSLQWSGARRGWQARATVRLISREPAADAILGYLRQGDLHSAEAMMVWAELAGNLLAGKRRDPYAATAGAYLLLKLKRYDLLRDWARNLANWFKYLPDGKVIWAWQTMRQSPKNVKEIRSYLLEAASALPVYTQGLRLLMDGLALFPGDKKVEQERRNLAKACGVVLWSSPVTAGILPNPEGKGRSTREIFFDVRYGA